MRRASPVKSVRPKARVLRPGSLYPLIAGFFSEPQSEFVEESLLLWCCIASSLLIASDRRQKVEMDADHPFGMGVAEARSDEDAPIAALRGETSVAQRVVHQFGDAVGDLLDAKARLARPIERIHRGV